MLLTGTTPQMETIDAPEEKTLDVLPSCPVCNGPLVLLREFYRCTRCCFRICESCEGEVDGDN